MENKEYIKKENKLININIENFEIIKQQNVNLSLFVNDLIMFSLNKENNFNFKQFEKEELYIKKSTSISIDTSIIEKLKEKNVVFNKLINYLIDFGIKNENFDLKCYNKLNNNISNMKYYISKLEKENNLLKHQI